MAWRYYAQRAGTGLWLDTNVQLADPTLSWVLSGPSAGKATIPPGITNTLGEDGRDVFGKWDTLLFAEEDGDLAWFGICTNANPSKSGTQLEFIGLLGWFAGLPYTGEYRTWKTPLWNAIRELLTATKEGHTNGRVRRGIPYNANFSGGAGFFAGDEQPPPKPETGTRPGNWTDDMWDQWVNTVSDLQAAWQEKYGNREQFELLWWEAPMVGNELDNISKEYNFEFREGVHWKNRGALDWRINLDFSDEFTRRRTDIEFVDGINLAAPLDTKEDTGEFGNRVIGLGAGEGRSMLMAEAGRDDERLSQTQVVQYKAINAQSRLDNLVREDLKTFISKEAKIDTVQVWDIPGYAPVSSLLVGDEVKVRSTNTHPAIDSWVRVISITRNTAKAVTVVNLEAAS